MDYSRRNIILLFSSQAVALTSTITILTYSALVGEMLTGSTGLATIPAATGLVAAALTAYPASMFMKRFGRRRGFQLGAIFALIAGLLTFYGIFTANFIIFTLGVMAHGVFQAFFAFYRFTALEITAPRMHKQALSYVLAGGLLAAAVAPTMARFFERHFYLPIEYAGTYLLVVFLSLLTLLLLSFLKFPETVVQQEKDNIVGVPQPTLWQVVNRPAFLCASLNAAGAYLVMSYIMASSTLEIVEYAGFKVNDAASIIQWHVAAMFLPAFFSGSLIARFGTIKILSVGIASLALSALFALQGLELVNFYGTSMLIGLGWNFTFTAGTILLGSAYSPAEKARVQGINDFIVNGLTAVATLSSGYLLATIGWMNMNRLVFGIVFLMIIGTVWYVRHTRKISGPEIS
ncbi:MAG: MFS transporter [Alphaproteobacteria bacterium]|nr:MFS transporter [Alphaproteobacteria bacterium]